MSSRQGNYDASSNVPLWSAASVNLAPTSTNAGNLYENVTANDFITGATVGVFGVDSNESIVNNNHPGTGWVLRTVGSGGRTGRVTEEVLSWVSKFRTDNNADDTVYPDASITFTANTPGQKSFTAGSGNSNTFTITATAKPTGATLSYLWQVNTGSAWATAANGQTALTTYVGNTTNSLTVYATGTAANTYKYRCVVTATPPAGITNATAVTVASANGNIVIY